MSRSYKTGALALVAAMVIWSGTYVVGKAVLDQMGPATLIALRFGIAFLVLLPFAARRGFRLGQVLERRFLIFGFTGIVLHIGLETVGLLFTSAAAAALIVAANPATSAALSVVFLGERLDRGRRWGIALSVIGTVMVAITQVEGGGSNQILGNLLVLGGVIAWGAFTVQGRKLGADVPAIVSTTACAGSALLMLVPTSAVEIAVTGAPNMTLGGVVGILYLGLGASAGAYGLWNLALRHVEATTAAPFVNLVPVLGLGLAVGLGDPAAPIQLIGGAIVIVGVWLGARDPQRYTSPERAGLPRLRRIRRAAPVQHERRSA